MKEFISTITMVDAATYIGVVLGILGLIVAGKKIISSTSQNQKVKNGTGIQVGRDLSVGKSNDSESER